jgi:hypothetical protein
MISKLKEYIKKWIISVVVDDYNKDGILRQIIKGNK